MAPPRLLKETILELHSFFDRLYFEKEIPSPDFFLLEAEEDLGNGGRLLISEHETHLEIGIQFGKGLENRFEDPRDIGAHEIGIVAEEVSHFRILFLAAEQTQKISPLDLEVIGEIDRFVTLLYAHRFFPDQNWLRIQPYMSLSELCEQSFAQRSFNCSESTYDLYLCAEAVALSHLSRAFEYHWNCTSVDSLEALKKARNYLLELRSTVIRKGHAARLAFA